MSNIVRDQSRGNLVQNPQKLGKHAKKERKKTEKKVKKKSRFFFQFAP